MGGRLFLGMMMLGISLAAVPQARAVDAPYEQNLLRVAELLGSLHYLRNLCGDENTTWRDQMQALITSEEPDEMRRTRFNARFNQGYRSFASTHTTCTATAVEVIERFMLEGQTLTREIVSRYGN